MRSLGDAGLVTPSGYYAGEPCMLRRASGADGKELSSEKTIPAMLAVHIGGDSRFFMGGSGQAWCRNRLQST
jgi:hypothetical protein